LFGVGLAIQFERSVRSGRPLYWLARRIACAAAFGLVHLLLIWNGDILTEYAVAGVLVLPLLLLPSAWLLAIALRLSRRLRRSAPLLVYSIPWPDDATLRAHVAAAGQVYANGSRADTWRFSLAELPLILRLHAYAFPRTRRAVPVRRAVMEKPAFSQRAAGVSALRPRSRQSPALRAGAVLTATAPLGTIGGFLAPVVLALGYGAALLLDCSTAGDAPSSFRTGTGGAHGIQQLLAQSIVFAGIFFGYGLGQFGRMGAAPALVHGIGGFHGADRAQQWWLRR
jgi:uncharacterized protein